MKIIIIIETIVLIILLFYICKEVLDVVEWMAKLRNNDKREGDYDNDR